MPDLTAVRQRVEQLLLDKDIKLQVSKDFMTIPYQSTAVPVLVSAFGDHAVVSLRGIVGMDVPLTDELKCWVADKTSAYVFGHLSYTESTGAVLVEFRHNLLADFLDPEELMVAVSAVAVTANELSDEVHTKFGGRRWTDPPPDAGAPKPPDPGAAPPPPKSDPPGEPAT